MPAPKNAAAGKIVLMQPSRRHLAVAPQASPDVWLLTLFGVMGAHNLPRIAGPESNLLQRILRELPSITASRAVTISCVLRWRTSTRLNL
jgi:hypothetical protein